MKTRVPFLVSPALLICTTALALSTALNAGTVLTGEQSQPNGSSTTSTIAIDAGKARMESSMGGQEMVMIYRSDKDLFWIIDTAGKNYREMTRADMTAMAAQVEKAMQQMKEQLANLPPEQRAMMEKMMAGKLPAVGQTKAQSQTGYEKVGPGGKVGGWNTEKFIATTDGKKTSELWVAPKSEVTVPESDLKTMEKMMDFFREISSRFGAEAMPAIGPESELGGVPVKVVSFRNGNEIGTYLVTSVEQKNLPASDFEVPEGFTKLALGLPQN